MLANPCGEVILKDRVRCDWITSKPVCDLKAVGMIV
jgi:hypothetical protein